MRSLFEKTANRIRKKCLEMVYEGKSSHIGAALSCVDILTVLYGGVMRYQVENSSWPSRDRFILSKGHAGVAVYATLSEFGFLPTDLLSTHCANGSVLSGHVSHKDVNGVELSTGSLGHGLPVAVGMALAAKLNKTDVRVFVLIGDGEIAEGSNWEAFLFAAYHKLNNLTVIVDRNNLQSIDSTENTLALEPIGKKLEAFNWSVVDIDGHDHEALLAELTLPPSGQPKFIIAKTVKGKGVAFMENQVAWHYKTPSTEQLEMAIAGLGLSDAF